MTKLVLLVFSSLLGLTIGSDSHCQKNSIFKKCADPCPKICGEKHLLEKCHGKRCSPGCECEDGYILNHRGHCIPTKDCYNRKCGQNALHKDEPCSSTCANWFLNTPCDLLAEPGCQCRDGYFVNLNGDCVPGADCTVKDVECDANELFSLCASSCQMTCANMYLEYVCDAECSKRCDCQHGYVYNGNDECVMPADCPPVEVVCPIEGQAFLSSGVLRTCDNMYSIITPDIIREPGCYCSDGTVMDPNTNTCIPSYECEHSKENNACRAVDTNMKYYSSHIPCKITCGHLEPECVHENISGCFCNEGFVFNRRWVCVPLGECCSCEEY